MPTFTKLITLIGILFTSIIFGQNQLSHPERNFEYLWDLFDQKYANFEQKNHNWDDTYNIYRAKVTQKTTDMELFNIFKDMLKPLNDAHVKLTAPSIDAKFSARKPSKILVELSSVKNLRASMHKMTDNTLNKLGFTSIKEIGPKYKGNKLFAYSNNDKTGYLRFHRSASKIIFGMPIDSPFLNKQLEKIFKSFKQLETLIIDIRFNIGGNDEFVNKIVGRLIEEEFLAYYKQEKLNKNQFGPLHSISVKPQGKSKFLKKVYLLTNDLTVSAADVLTLMIQQLPNSTIVGDNSNGSFSDILSKKLPNGWNINLSNERYFSIDMKNYEGSGVPVDVYAHTTLKDIKDKNDSVLLKTLALIEAANLTP